MKKTILILTLLPNVLFAQKTMSLRACADLLTKHNLVYRQGDLQAEAANANLRQSKSQILPQIAVNFNNSINLGRSIDQYTNAYIDEVYKYSAIYTGFQLPIFQGGRLQNQIRQNVLLKESAMENRLAVLNSQTVLLMQGYVNVLATKALLESAEKQVEASEQQFFRISRQVDAGVVGNNLLLEIKSQLAKDKFDAVTANNNYRMARLSLFQVINLAPDDSVEFEALPVWNGSLEEADAGRMYEEAQSVFPELRSADLYRKSFTYQVKSIKAQNLPSLSLGANFGAFYASTNNTLEYFDQLNATRNGSLSVNLNIPIMGRWLTKPRVEAAKVQERVAQNQMQQTDQLLRQAIEQAVLNMNGSKDRYEAAKEQSDAQIANFDMVKSRLEAGTANLYEFALAKANLAKAEANAIQAKYLYLMQQRIVKYYQSASWEGVL